MRAPLLTVVALAVALLAASWFFRLEVADIATARNVLISTTACGNASGTSGTGVVVGDSMILTAAHIVIAAGSVEVLYNGSTMTAEIVGLDPRTDLALLVVSGIDATPIALDRARVDEVVGYIDLAGEFRSAAITRLLEIRIEEERSTVRSSRFGFEIDRTVELGGSGAGVFLSLIHI